MTGTQASKVPFGKSDGFRRFKLAIKRLIGREPRFSLDLRCKLQKFGVWQVCPDAELKMDIEGAEYGVLTGLLASDLCPGQLLIEFHHRHAGMDKSQTVQAIAALRSAGYGLTDISASGREFMLVLRSELENRAPN